MPWESPYSCGGDYDRGESDGRDQTCLKDERELELEAELVHYSRLTSSVVHFPPLIRLGKQPVGVASILLLCYATLR